MALDRASEPRANAGKMNGRAGLMINEATVKGVVKSRGRMLAMVQAPDNKTYIVRASDRLLDGEVRAVTAEAVVFVQNVNDPLSPVRQRRFANSADCRGGSNARETSGGSAHYTHAGDALELSSVAAKSITFGEAQAAQAPAATELTGVEVGRNADGVTVTLGERQAGAWHAPEADRPPCGWSSTSRASVRTPPATPGQGALRRVRVALNNPNPLVTRVVLDLDVKVTYSVKASPDGREDGRARRAVGRADGGRTGAPAPTAARSKRPAADRVPWPTA
jgi:hypothetical protein